MTLPWGVLMLESRGPDLLIAAGADAAEAARGLKLPVETIVAGIDAFGPRWDPIVYRQEEEGIVHDPNAYNHLGYRAPFAWISSQFSGDAYAYRASVELMNYLRNPDLTIRLTSWLQPDLFPMDVIRFQSRRAGTAWLRLVVTGVRHAITPNIGRTAIRAQFIPETVFG